MTSVAMPERHRELIPIAGLTGSARSATGAQRRSTTAMPPHKVEQAGLTGVSAWVRGRRTRTPTPQGRRHSQPRTVREIEGNDRSPGGGQTVGAQGMGGRAAARQGAATQDDCARTQEPRRRIGCDEKARPPRGQGRAARVH